LASDAKFKVLSCVPVYRRLHSAAVLRTGFRWRLDWLVCRNLLILGLKELEKPSGQGWTGLCHAAFQYKNAPGFYVTSAPCRWISPPLPNLIDVGNLLVSPSDLIRYSASAGRNLAPISENS